MSETGLQLSHDLFVSYSQSDRAWVEGYLLDALAAANMSFISELNFTLGAPRINEFEAAIKQSKRTLLVLSYAYVTEAGLNFVDIMVQHYGLESGTCPVIPLVLEPVELPPRLAFLVALDATDIKSSSPVITSRIVGQISFICQVLRWLTKQVANLCNKTCQMHYLG